MNELIKVSQENDRVTVLGRDLHEFLEIETKYMDWFYRMLEYGFLEGTDYIAITQKREIWIGKGLTDHQLTLDMAKEISMIQRNEKGKQARQYFIECENKLRKPMCIEDMIIQSAQQLKEIRIKQLEYESRLTIVEAKQTNSPYEFFSIVGYCNLNGIKCELSNAKKWGKEASQLSKDLGIKIGTTFNTVFGQVNTYHIDILKSLNLE